MSIFSMDRGHEIEEIDGNWVYVDNGAICENDRPCKKCGLPPTPEGYDACLGKLENVQYACCGHGVTEKHIVYKAGESL